MCSFSILPITGVGAFRRCCDSEFAPRLIDSQLIRRDFDWIVSPGKLPPPIVENESVTVAIYTISFYR